MIFILMAMLEILVCVWIIVIKFPVLSPEIELVWMRVVSNIGVYKGIQEGN